MAGNIPSNPWMKMWVRPRQTIRGIVDVDPTYRIVLLSMIYGLPVMFQIAQNLSLAMSYSLPIIVLGSLILCAAFGYLGLSIASALLYWTGKWIGGTGSYLQVRCAVSWANVTNIATIVLWALLIVTFKQQAFLEEFAQSTVTQAQMNVIAFTFFAQSVVSVWSFILLLHSLGEVQGFSVWKALLNVIISFGIVIAVMWVLGMALA